MNELKNNFKDIIDLTKQFNILYAEDDELLREKSIMMFSHLFNNIDACENGEEAFELYKKSLHDNTPYDLVITDINMPKMDGIKLSKLVRELKSSQKILIVSAYNDSDKLEKIIDLGITNYIHKPYKIDKLLEAIKKVSLQIEENKHHQKQIDNIKNIEGVDAQTGIKTFTPSTRT